MICFSWYKSWLKSLILEGFQNLLIGEAWSSGDQSSLKHLKNEGSSNLLKHAQVRIIARDSLEQDLWK